MTINQSFQNVKDELSKEIEKIRGLRRHWRIKSTIYRYLLIGLTALAPFFLGVRPWATTAEAKENLALAAFVAGALAAFLTTIDSSIRTSEIYIHYCESLTQSEIMLSDIEFAESKGLESVSAEMVDDWHAEIQDLRRRTFKVWSQLRTSKRAESEKDTPSPEAS